MILALLIPMAALACHCCPMFSAPDSSQETAFHRAPCNSCCFTFTAVKEAAPRVEKFVHLTQEVLAAFFQLTPVSSAFSASALPAAHFDSSGSPGLFSIETPRYLSLSILRV